MTKQSTKVTHIPDDGPPVTLTLTPAMAQTIAQVLQNSAGTIFSWPFTTPRVLRRAASDAFERAVDDAQSATNCPACGRPLTEK